VQKVTRWNHSSVDGLPCVANWNHNHDTTSAAALWHHAGGQQIKDTFFNCCDPFLDQCTQTCILCDSSNMARMIKVNVSDCGVFLLMRWQTAVIMNRWPVARYVDQVDNQYIVREDPFTMVDVFTEQQLHEFVMAPKWNSVEKNLSCLILSAVGKASLNTGSCVGQGHDKASTMAADSAGAAALIQETAPLTDYYHCDNHATNLTCSRCINVTLFKCKYCSRKIKSC